MPECLDCGQVFIDKIPRNNLAVYGICEPCKPEYAEINFGALGRHIQRLPGADDQVNHGIPRHNFEGIGIDGRATKGKWPNRWDNDEYKWGELPVP